MNRELPNLTVHQLIYIREAATAPTLAIAAERLGVSQPALSQGLAEVERRLGSTLFDRRGRTRVPAAAFGAVVEVAKLVLAAVDDLDRHLAEIATGTRGALRVGMIDTAALGAFAEPLAVFRHQRPGVHTTLLVDGSIRLSEQVADGTLDLAIVVTPNAIIDHDPDRFTAVELTSEPLLIYPSTARLNVPLSELGPWVSFPAGSETRNLVTRALAARGVTMEVAAESSNPDVLRQMVLVGVGSCVLPQTVGRGGSSPLTPLETKPLTSRPLSLIRRRNALPHAAADGLAAALVSAAARTTNRRR